MSNLLKDDIDYQEEQKIENNQHKTDKGSGG